MLIPLRVQLFEEGEGEPIVVTGDNINDRLKSWLEQSYITEVFPAADLATLIQYDLTQRSGDYTTRFKALLADASA